MDIVKKHRATFRRTVMVVDDEVVNRMLLGDILSSEYKVIYAENGRQALEQMQAHRQTLSLVLLDLLMPEMDGYAVLKKMHGDSLLSKIPVIVLTSEKSAEIESLQIGAADFLTKPYGLPELILARVRHSIRLAEAIKTIQVTETDSLTGLYTREFFFLYGHQLDRRQPDVEMDSIVLDFNRFHILNELYGAAFCDKVLCIIADSIMQITGESNGLACRYDADTFYVYVRHRDDYNTVLNRIKAALSTVLTAPEVRLRMGVSHHTDSFDEATLEQRFDRALQACNALRNRHASSFAIYNMDMHKNELYAARLLEDFEKAIAQKQFKVCYQPKFNIKGGAPKLSSAEALIRWQHPELGFISPGLFVPLFEENGFVQRRDRYVWQEAACQMRRWKERYGVIVPVSVNVSRVDIFDPEMVDFVLGLVTENGIPPSDYLLEITESAYTDNSQQIVQVVNRLRAEGFRIEMDDFGSGYSSLNMLTSLPIDVLKLDMAFIRGIAAGNKELRMVELILEIADFLKVPVIAEGVETQEQYELLKAAGCDIIQGYYFSKPLFPDEFGLLIERENLGK